MATISKLRLKQSQGELAEFARGTVSHKAASEDTLHALLGNLAVSLEKRFGIGQDNSVSGKPAIGNMYEVEHVEGVVAHFDSPAFASDLVIKTESTTNPMRIEAGETLSASADAFLMKAVNRYDIENAGYRMYSDKEFSIEGKESSKIEVLDIGQILSLHADNSEAKIEMTADAHISGASKVFRMDMSSLVDVDSKGDIQLDAAGKGWLVAANIAKLESTGANVEVHAFADVNVLGATKTETISGAKTLNAGTLTETVTGASVLSYAAVTETMSGAHSETGLEYAGSFSGANGYTLSAAAGEIGMSAGQAFRILAGQEVEAEGSFVHLSASTSFVRMNDKFRLEATTLAQNPMDPASYQDGIKLAAKAEDWRDFEATFGEVSLLEAIRTAALGGTSTAADYKIAIASNTIAANTKLSLWGESGQKFDDLGVGQTAGVVAINAPLPCTGYSVNEAERNVRIFVNGQRLVIGEDYDLNFSNGTVDPQIKWDLELNDNVMIEIG
jgi:hypothetical protein